MRRTIFPDVGEQEYTGTIKDRGGGGERTSEERRGFYHRNWSSSCPRCDGRGDRQKTWRAALVPGGGRVQIAGESTGVYDTYRRGVIHVFGEDHDRGASRRSGLAACSSQSTSHQFAASRVARRLPQ